MLIELGLAEDETAQTEIFLHRYDIYCQELNRYRAEADHERRILREDIDADRRRASLSIVFAGLDPAIHTASAQL